MNSTNATSAHARKTVRIGGASGFWGDSAVGAPQLVRKGQVDFLVFDYLAELTMSILAGARLKNPAMGYATDFVDVAMRHGVKDFTTAKWQAWLELKDYFDKLAGRSIYSLLPDIVENTFA